MKECLRRQSPLDLRRIYGTTEVVPYQREPSLEFQ